MENKITDTERLDWILKNCYLQEWDVYDKVYLSVPKTRRGLDEIIKSRKKHKK